MGDIDEDCIADDLCVVVDKELNAAVMPTVISAPGKPLACCQVDSILGRAMTSRDSGMRRPRAWNPKGFVGASMTPIEAPFRRRVGTKAHHAFQSIRRFRLGLQARIFLRRLCAGTKVSILQP